MEMHHSKLNSIKAKDAGATTTKDKGEVEAITDQIKQTKTQSHQFKQLEKNSEINRENQILLGKLVEISSGKWSSVTKAKAKKKVIKNKKSLNYGYRRAEYERIERENAAFAQRLLQK